jgi:hypothetical protein
VDGVTWLRDVSEGKEVALPGIGAKGGCADWCIQKGVSDYVVDSESEVVGVKPRFVKKLLNSKKAREISIDTYKTEIWDQSEQSVGLPPAAQPTDHYKLLFSV